MKEVPPSSADERPELLRALGQQGAQRHRALEHYILVWFTSFGLLRRFGMDPLSWQGHLATGLPLVMFLLAPPLIITAISGQWAAAEIQRWAIVAVTFGLAGGGLYRPYRNASENITALHRTMADESGLRRWIAWERRWWSMGRSMLIGATFAVATLVVLFKMRQLTPTAPLSAGSIVVGAMLLYQVGEIAYAFATLGLEFRILASYKYELYRLSPIDSVALQRSIRGHNAAAVLNSLIPTVFIIEFAILLPAHPGLIAQIAFVLLIITYISVGFGFFAPRLVMRQIIQAEKEREMAPLQRRLNDLLTRLRELTGDEYEEMKRLKEVYAQIRNSSEDVLPMRAVVQILGSPLLPTVTFVATVTGEFYLRRLLESLFP